MIASGALSFLYCLLASIGHLHGETAVRVKRPRQCHPVDLCSAAYGVGALIGHGHILSIGHLHGETAVSVQSSVQFHPADRHRHTRRLGIGRGNRRLASIGHLHGEAAVSVHGSVQYHGADGRLRLHIHRLGIGRGKSRRRSVRHLHRERAVSVQDPGELHAGDFHCHRRRVGAGRRGGWSCFACLLAPQPGWMSNQDGNEDRSHKRLEIHLRLLLMAESPSVRVRSWFLTFENERRPGIVDSLDNGQVRIAARV